MAKITLVSMGRVSEAIRKQANVKDVASRKMASKALTILAKERVVEKTRRGKALIDVESYIDNLIAADSFDNVANIVETVYNVQPVKLIG